jgi:DNA polymerase-3 subunit epsilon
MGADPTFDLAAGPAGAPMATPAGSGPLDGVTFAVVDVETSGLKTKSHRLLQVGVVMATGDGTVLDRWSSFVRPRWWRVARLGPTEIHGISRGDLREAPGLAEVYAELAPRLDGAVVTAHNVAFDWAFLQRGAQRAHRPLPAGQRLCTLRLSRSLDPEHERSHRLADLCERYGVQNARAHHALADADATAAILPFLLREAGITSRADLDQRLER